MTHHLILLGHADVAAAARFRSALAARGLDVDVVPIRSPYQGMSAAYDALAQTCLAGGRVLPGLLQRYRPPRHGYASTWLVCWSGAYALARAMRPADRAELAGLVLLDGGHTTLEADGTALDAGVKWLVDWAKDAKAGRTTLWIGHTDVRTYGTTASTTQVAAEVLKLAGGQGGRFLVRAYDGLKDDRAEHIAARDGWGPTFVADAMDSALGGSAPASERPTPEPPTPEAPTPRVPRMLRRGARGDDVGDLQRRLLELGHDPGSPDESFGPLTEAAVRELQRDAGIAVDGVVGPQTRAAMDRAAPKTLPKAPPAGLAAAFLARARADLAAGVREIAPNWGDRIKDMLAAVGVTEPANWCAAAVTTWLREAARGLGVEPPVRGSAGAKALMAQLQQAGRWVSAEEIRRDPSLIQPGMVAVWHRGAPGAWTGHVAAVASAATGSRFTSIDGNGGPRGDRVDETSRDLNDPLLLGVGRVG